MTGMEHMKLRDPSDNDVFWHNTIASVPHQYPTLILGHEFLDALPIQKFQYTKKGWREILVDLKEHVDWVEDDAAPRRSPLPPGIPRSRRFCVRTTTWRRRRCWAASSRARRWSRRRARRRAVGLRSGFEASLPGTRQASQAAAGGGSEELGGTGGWEWEAGGGE